MAKRFHSIYKSDKNLTYNVEIWDDDFVGTSTEFRIGAGGFNLRMAGEGGKILAFINSTECSFDFQIQDTTHEALVDDFLTATEGRFTVKITKGTGSPTNYWIGMVVPDIGTRSEEYYPINFTIKATDGIGVLKDIDFKDTAGAYTGKARLTDIVKNALKKLPYIATHYASGDAFISTIVDMWETTMLSGGTDPCFFYQQYFDYSVFQKYEKGQEKYTSCYDVLKEAMESSGTRITQRNGVFWIEQIFYRTAAPVIIRTYSRDGGLISTANYSTLNDINQTNAGALLAVGHYEYFPGLRKVEHVFKSRLRRNYLEQVKDSEITSLTTINKPIDDNSGLTTLRLSGNISLSISSDSPNPANPFPQLIVIFRLELVVNTYRLRRNYDLEPTYQIVYDPMIWTTNAGDAIFIGVRLDNPYFLLNAGSTTFTFAQLFDEITPFVLEKSDNFQIRFTLHAISDYEGNAFDPNDFTINYDFADKWLEVYSEGTPKLATDEDVYDVENTLYETNSAVIETESILGTSSDPNALGARWVKPASDYVLATNWGIGVDAPSKYIERLIIEVAMSGQYAATEKLQGTLFGNIEQMARVSWNGKYWLFLGGSWNSDRDELTGEWVELKYDQDFNSSPPVKRKTLVVSTEIPTLPPSSGQGGATYELVAKPPGTLFYPVSLTTTDSALTKGAVITSVDISEVLTDGDVYAGDTIVILNPITGTWDALSVTATSVAGQTAIAATGTLSDNYPKNSPIIKKPKIGTFSLPEGTTGDILYYDGAKWVVRNIGTTGQVLSVSGGVPVWGSAGAGSVTSVALSMPTAIFDVAGSPINGSGTFTVTLDNQSANTVFAGPTTGGATIPAFRALVAADIPNLDASKITTGTFAIVRGGTGLSALGTALQYLRVNAGGTALEYATLSAGNITGTMTATRLQFAASATALDDDSNLTWDDTNKRLLIGTGATQAFLNVFSGAITGTTEFLRMSGNINGNMIAYLLNANNASTGANAFFGIQVGGASAGDPFIQYIVSGVTTWAAGVDNSDSDAFKIANSSTVGTVGTDLLIIGTDGRVSIGGTALLALVDLTIDGTGGIRVPSGTSAQRPTITNTIIRNNTAFGGLEFKNPFGQWHRIYGSNPTGTITPGPGAGTSPTINAVGTDRAFKLNITTGSAPTLNGEILTINFGTAFDILPYIALTAYNAVTATDYNKFYIDFNSVGGFSIKANGTLTAFTTYVLSVVVQQ